MTEKREPPFKLDTTFGEKLARYVRTNPSVVSGAPGAIAVQPIQGELELVHYQTPECAADLTLDPSNNTLWATQHQMGDVFGIAAKTVGEHLGNIFREGELEQESVARKFRVTAKDGKQYNTLHYNLDAILSVGYRVSSKRGTAFRKWATGILREYVAQGFANPFQ